MPKNSDWLHLKLKSKAPQRAAAGQSLVELALTLPLLLLILIGVIDLGRVYFAYMSIVNAAREGARYGAAYPTATTAIKTHAFSEASGSGITLTETNIAISCPVGGSCTQGNPIQVTVQYNFQLITTYLFGGGTIPLQASNQMVVFGQ